MVRTVRELRHLAEKNNESIVRIYNPDTENFTCKYNGVSYTIFALEIEEFPLPIANHIKKHLADHILNKRGVPLDSNPQDFLKEIYKEIEVEV